MSCLWVIRSISIKQLWTIALVLSIAVALARIYPAGLYDPLAYWLLLIANTVHYTHWYHIHYRYHWIWVVCLYFETLWTVHNSILPFGVKFGGMQIINMYYLRKYFKQCFYIQHNMKWTCNYIWPCVQDDSQKPWDQRLAEYQWATQRAFSDEACCGRSDYHWQASRHAVWGRNKEGSGIRLAQHSSVQMV